MPDTPPNPTPPTPSGKDRDLAADAVRQADARPGSSAFGVPPAIPPDFIPGYEILREIHRGGQGVVYQAMQKSTRRKVAIKVVKEGPFAGSSERARFEREVQVLGQLNHPSIVAIHDSGAVAGSHYFVMDYISGHALDVWARSASPSIEAVLRLFGAVCEAVSAAHLRGVIHRDLKPGNIRVDAEGQPHILDFGLAKLAGKAGGAEARAMTLTGQFIGSLPWASPEQAGGTPERIDIRTDVYSLGVILYQLLTGRFPYDVVGNMRDVLDNIVRAQPARPSTVQRRINNEIETIVLKCLSKERERRYQSAGELARDIQRYLSGEPIEAKRDSGWYVITKTLNRYRPHVAVAAAFLVLMTAASVQIVYLWQAARRSEKEARVSEAAARAESQRANENVLALRSLARTVLEADEPLRRLRGATVIREAFARATPEALGLMRPADSDRPAIRREAAASWEKYGDLLGAVFQPNTGDHARARAAHAEASRIRQQLLREFPELRESHSDMAESHARSAQLSHAELDYGAAGQHYIRALAEFDQALSMAPAISEAEARPLRDRRGAVLIAYGDALRFRAQASPAEEAARGINDARAAYLQAERYWAERARAAPGDRTAARWLGVCRDNRANLEIQLGQILSSRGAAAPGFDIRAVIRHFDDAIGLASESLAEFQRLSTEFPQNAEWRRDLFLAHHTIGLAHQQAGMTLKKAATIEAGLAAERDDRFRSAAASFNEAVRMVSAISAADEANAEARRDLAIGLNKAGNMLRELGSLAEAAERFKESLAIREEINRVDPTSRSRSDLAVGLYKCGEIEERRAAAVGDAAVSKRHYEESARYYADAAASYDLLRSVGAAVAEADRAEVAASLARVRAKLEAMTIR